MEECYSCRSLSGEKRISPGPVIYTGQHWVIEHAYPCKMVGWLVLVLKRHAAALHELSREEFLELAELQEKTAKILHRELNTQKEYSMCLAEAEHFEHIHFHIVAKAVDLPKELKGTGIFAMLKGEEDLAVKEQIKQFCEDLATKFQ
jgi:diadenosine tetraphosphate (Ap4A) HIT family hydrolase